MRCTACGDKMATLTDFITHCNRYHAKGNQDFHTSTVQGAEGAERRRGWAEEMRRPSKEDEWT